ncbi:MAG: TIGR03085 family metal-binding protein [Angustibacter sp.]
MSRYAHQERHALCDTLATVGPDAPTLCDGWDARQLAAHLAVRERRPDAAAGLLLGPLARHTQRVQERLAATASTTAGWRDLVELVRGGPPAWHPTRLTVLDELGNTAEMFIHHEDLRRAAPGWVRRELTAGHEAALWRACRTLGRGALRRAPVGVRLDAPGIGHSVVRPGHPMVRVQGAASEVLLFAVGRRAVAQVELDGPEPAVQRLLQVPSGV